VRVSDTGDVIELPKKPVQLLTDILASMAEANAVTLIPVHAELTPEKKACIVT